MDNQEDLPESESVYLKVAACIIREVKNDTQILAFKQQHDPDLLMQFPGGTVEKGEPLEKAIVREIEEESGLKDLQLIRKLGRHDSHWEGRPLRRHFYLFQINEQVPDHWEHIVTGGGEDDGFVYCYEWILPWKEEQLHPNFRVFLSDSDLPECFSGK